MHVSQERAAHPRVQLTLEERLRQRLSEKRRSGRARVLKARELANATPQERARFYWGVMREAVLAMHQNAAGEGSARRSTTGGSQASSAVASTIASARESYHKPPQEGRTELTEKNDPCSRDTTGTPDSGTIPVVSFRGGATETPLPSSGRVQLVEVEGEVADVTGEYTGECPARSPSSQSIDTKLSKMVHHSEERSEANGAVTVITDTPYSERPDRG